MSKRPAPDPLNSENATAKAMRTSLPSDSFTDLPYENLPPDTIRLIVVHPGTSTHHLECSIVTRQLAALDRKGRPQINQNTDQIRYEALSYSWDGQLPSHLIRIRKPTQGYYNFVATKNLHEALSTLRSISENRYFWVDAVCIDQHNNDDKNQQLPLMARIYAEAITVCVWLGMANESTEAAFGLMKKIEAVNDYDRVVERLTDCEEWVAFHDLIKRAWFSRRWVVQEIIMARNATLHCGGHNVGWKDFQSSIGLFELMADRVKTKFREHGKYEHHPDMFGETDQYGAHKLVATALNVVSTDDEGQVVEKNWTLESLVSRLVTFESGTPHDIIYALLSLASDVESASATSSDLGVRVKPEHLTSDMLEHIRSNGLDVDRACKVLSRVLTQFAVHRYPVDYHKNFYLVCRDFYVWITERTLSLDMICRPWVPTGAFGANMPVPSWIRPVREVAFGQDAKGVWGRVNPDPLVGLPGESPYQASKLYKGPAPKFSTDPKKPTLTTNGFILAQIGHVEDAAREGAIPREWLEYSDLGSPRLSGRTTAERIQVRQSFWRTMVAGRAPDGKHPPQFYASVCEKVFNNRHEYGDVSIARIHDRSTNSLEKKFIKRVQAVVWGRRLTYIDSIGPQGALALVPRDTRRGDYICILFRCSVPVVLRASSPGELSGNKINGTLISKLEFKLIGESYVHGMMSGEAFDAWRTINGGQHVGYSTFQIGATL